MQVKNWIIAIAETVSTALGPIGAPIKGILEGYKGFEAEQVNNQLQAMIKETQEIQTKKILNLFEEKLDATNAKIVTQMLNDAKKYGEQDPDKSYSSLIAKGVSLNRELLGSWRNDFIKVCPNNADVKIFHDTINFTGFPIGSLNENEPSLRYFTNFVTIFGRLPKIIQLKTLETIKDSYSSDTLNEVSEKIF